jgi:hypothetical protein
MICLFRKRSRKIFFNLYIDMKRKIIIICFVLAGLLAVTFIGVYVWIGVSVQKNISTAKEIYGGKAEDTLIAYLQDESNSFHDRSHVAIWTLGQIRSQKAIPLLEHLYMDDPEGKTCKGKHDSVLCQYEIHKALQACRSNWWPLHERLNR